MRWQDEGVLRHIRARWSSALPKNGDRLVRRTMLAEVHATMTAVPVKDVIPPDQTLLFVQDVRDRFTIVTLTEAEYYDTIEQAAARGLTSGRIYDAPLLRCASKVHAEIVYTWNVKHFRMIRPDMAERIRTP